jgi:hypothetical protein
VAEQVKGAGECRVRELLSVRRFLSGTPLARAHEASVSRGTVRRRRPIPWERFERSGYAEPELALALDQTKRLAEGEYGAVGLFGQIASGLAMTCAPFDMISAAATVSGDEIRHADYCTRFASLCAGADVELSVDCDAVLRACSNLHLVEEVDHFLLKYSAVGETLAAALLTECRSHASDPVAHAMYTSITGDEVHHARLGWYYFSWRAPRWTDAERQRLADRIAEFVVDIEAEFWVGRDAPRGHEAAALALGVLDTARQREAIARVMEDEIIPGLDAIGLGGAHMWKLRKRGNDSATSAPSLVLPGFDYKPVALLHNDAPTALLLGARWLARAVGDDGQVRFSLDPETGTAEAFGPYHYGRAALAVAALDSVGGFADVVVRARERLDRDIELLLAGEPLPGAPATAAELAGTLALAIRAGVNRGAALLAIARQSDNFADDPWCASQVAFALGSDTPPELWALCTARFNAGDWAPWAFRAAAALGDRTAIDRYRPGLLAALGAIGDSGTSGEASPPALARIAATVEALVEDPDPTRVPRAALVRARDYLLRWQFDQPELPGVGSAAAVGGFPLTPTDWLERTDVTAHALAALVAVERLRIQTAKAS